MDAIDKVEMTLYSYLDEWLDEAVEGGDRDEEDVEHIRPYIHAAIDRFVAGLRASDAPGHVAREIAAIEAAAEEMVLGEIFVRDALPAAGDLPTARRRRELLVELRGLRNDVLASIEETVEDRTVAEYMQGLLILRVESVQDRATRTIHDLTRDIEAGTILPRLEKSAREIVARPTSPTVH